MGARINKAVTHAVLQRYAPLPTRRVGRRAGEWIGAARIAAWHRDRAVTRKPMRPVFVTRAKRLFDEQPAKSGAIDKQITFDHGTVDERHRLDIAALAIDFRIDDLPFDAVHAAAFSIAPEECRI